MRLLAKNIVFIMAVSAIAWAIQPGASAWLALVGGGFVTIYHILQEEWK
jgi:hypothetical protein